MRSPLSPALGFDGEGAETAATASAGDAYGARSPPGAAANLAGAARCNADARSDPLTAVSTWPRI